MERVEGVGVMSVMTVDELDRWLVVRQVAQMAQVTMQTVELWRRQGKVRARRVGGRWFYDPDSVQAHLERRK